MTQQITRLSPHQNGKVFGILFAISSLFFVVPAFLMFSMAVPVNMPGRPPMALILVAPIFYFVMGYLSVAIGCWLYNVLYKYIGGIEYEQVAMAGE